MSRRKRRKNRWLWFVLLVVLIALAVWVERLLPQPSPDYDRSDWPHWADADGDCQDTRHEVLVAESSIPVRFADERGCKVATGRWICPYTGRVITDPHELDVDHLVPLHEAHRSGGDAWSRDRKERFANALDDDDHLVAVAKGANRSKGDKGPDAWLPESGAYRCAYVRDWVRIKAAWELAMDDAEREAIDRIIATCDAGKMPPSPADRVEPAPVARG